MPHQDRHIEARTNDGWGVASLVIALALVCIATATYIHNKTYKSPNDVTFHARGERTR
jgi:hypothetical protein